jgi:hypothetical protein
VHSRCPARIGATGHAAAFIETTFIKNSWVVGPLRPDRNGLSAGARERSIRPASIGGRGTQLCHRVRCIATKRIPSVLKIPLVLRASTVAAGQFHDRGPRYASRHPGGLFVNFCEKTLIL